MSDYAREQMLANAWKNSEDRVSALVAELESLKAKRDGSAELLRAIVDACKISLTQIGCELPMLATAMKTRCNEMERLLRNVTGEHHE